MDFNRRKLIGGAAMLAAGAAALPAFGKVKPFAPFYGPRSRTVYIWPETSTGYSPQRT